MITVRNRNFSGRTTILVRADVYINCNFMQPSPRIVDGKRRGVVLAFPHATGPMTFMSCNGINAEFPPGSTLTLVNTAMIEYGVDDGAGGTKRVCYGRRNTASGEYEDRETPEEFPDIVRE